MLVCIAAAAVVLIVVGSFGYPVYTYTENTKVLLYHLVSDETYGPNEYLFVRVSDFESQLAAIKRLGYETVFADEMENLAYKGRWVTDDYMAGFIEEKFEEAVAQGELLCNYTTTCLLYTSDAADD